MHSFRQNLVKELNKVNKKFEIYEATNGKEALEILSEIPIDLAVLDIEMPDTKGNEVFGCNEFNASVA